MSAKILIPTPLRAFTGQQAVVEVDGAATVAELLERLTTKHPEVRNHLYAADGKLRSFVNIYVNDEDIRYTGREATPVKSSDTVSIVPSVAGGSGAAVAGTTGTSVDDLPALSNDEVARYSRHLILPEVGMDGQRKLKAAKILCVGAGGLGAPASLYLAAAGIGTIGLVDFDNVDASNLQRQVLFSTSDVGKPKVQAAAARLKG
jgi:molybdopterin converting factor small subunit